MTEAMKTLGIDRMTPEDRLELMFDIWDSLAALAEVRPLTSDEEQLIDERLADPDDGVPWEDVRDELLGDESP